MTVIDRLLDKVERVTESGCWVFSGAVDPCGYARIALNGVNRQAHRVSYELHVGEIPAGMQIDHLCKVRCCVNPAHLEVVTQAENTRRADSYAKGHKRNKTHCPSGHEYSDESTGWRKNVKSNGEVNLVRYCKSCSKEASRARYLNKIGRLN